MPTYNQQELDFIRDLGSEYQALFNFAFDKGSEAPGLEEQWQAFISSQKKLLDATQEIYVALVNKSSDASMPDAPIKLLNEKLADVTKQIEQVNEIIPNHLYHLNYRMHPSGQISLVNAQGMPVPQETSRQKEYLYLLQRIASLPTLKDNDQQMIEEYDELAKDIEKFNALSIHPEDRFEFTFPLDDQYFYIDVSRLPAAVINAQNIARSSITGLLEKPSVVEYSKKIIKIRALFEEYNQYLQQLEDDFSLTVHASINKESGLASLEDKHTQEVKSLFKQMPDFPAGLKEEYIAELRKLHEKFRAGNENLHFKNSEPYIIKITKNPASAPAKLVSYEKFGNELKAILSKKTQELLIDKWSTLFSFSLPDDNSQVSAKWKSFFELAENFLLNEHNAAPVKLKGMLEGKIRELLLQPTIRRLEKERNDLLDDREDLQFDVELIGEDGMRKPEFSEKEESYDALLKANQEAKEDLNLSTLIVKKKNAIVDYLYLALDFKKNPSTDKVISQEEKTIIQQLDLLKTEADFSSIMQALQKALFPISPDKISSIAKNTSSSTPTVSTGALFLKRIATIRAANNPGSTTVFAINTVENKRLNEESQQNKKLHFETLKELIKESLDDYESADRKIDEKFSQERRAELKNAAIADDLKEIIQTITTKPNLSYKDDSLTVILTLKLATRTYKPDCYYKSEFFDDLYILPASAIFDSKTFNKKILSNLQERYRPDNSKLNRVGKMLTSTLSKASGSTFKEENTDPERSSSFSFSLRSKSFRHFVKETASSSSESSTNNAAPSPLEAEPWGVLLEIFTNTVSTFNNAAVIELFSGKLQNLTTEYNQPDPNTGSNKIKVDLIIALKAGLNDNNINGEHSFKCYLANDLFANEVTRSMIFETSATDAVGSIEGINERGMALLQHLKGTFRSQAPKEQAQFQNTFSDF
jgi:hypothetical protein